MANFQISMNLRILGRPKRPEVGQTQYGISSVRGTIRALVATPSPSDHWFVRMKNSILLPIYLSNLLKFHSIRITFPTILCIKALHPLLIESKALHIRLRTLFTDHDRRTIIRSVIDCVQSQKSTARSNRRCSPKKDKRYLGHEHAKKRRNKEWRWMWLIRSLLSWIRILDTRGWLCFWSAHRPFLVSAEWPLRTPKSIPRVHSRVNECTPLVENGCIHVQIICCDRDMCADRAHSRIPQIRLQSGSTSKFADPRSPDRSAPYFVP